MRLFRIPALFLSLLAASFAIAALFLSLLAASFAIAAPADGPKLFPSVVNVEAAQPPEVAPAPKPKEMYVTDEDGNRYRVVNREQLRFKSVKKRFSLPEGNAAAIKDVKDPPATFDFTNGGKYANNILGNNRYGDCFLAAIAHQVQIWSGMNGKPFYFDESKVVKRYLQLSPRDQGLSDEDVIPEWRAGFIGPNGDHKILDTALIDPADWKTVKSVIYRLGGVVTTHSLRTPWESGIKDGMIWDATGRIDPNAGHAVMQGGVTVTSSGKEALITETWAIRAYLTQAGLANSNAEVLVSVSAEWFNAKGYTPNGDHYEDIAKYWEAGTGHKLPQGLFPAPGPEPAPPMPVPPQPTPVPPGPNPAPSTGSVVVDPATRTVTIPDGWTVKGGGVNPAPKPTPGNASVGGKVVLHRAAVKLARKDGAGLIVSESELAAAKAKIEKALALSDQSLDGLLKDAGAPVAGDNKAGPLTDLLDWISNHSDEIEKIIAIIMKLVMLFA